VGLIQREIEKGGIPTISVTLSPVITRKVNVPRAVDFGFPLGHPFGFPNQKFLQRRLIRLLLTKMGTIDEKGTILTIPFYKGEKGECLLCDDLE